MDNNKGKLGSAAGTAERFKECPQFAYIAF